VCVCVCESFYARQVAWYLYDWASEGFIAVGITLFMPLLLNATARLHALGEGYPPPLITYPCIAHCMIPLCSHCLHALGEGYEPHAPPP